MIQGALDPNFIDAQGGINQGEAQILPTQYDFGATVASLAPKPVKQKPLNPDLPKTGGWGIDQPELGQHYQDLTKFYATNAAKGIDLENPVTGQGYIDMQIGKQQYLDKVKKSTQDELLYNTAINKLQDPAFLKSIKDPKAYEQALNDWKAQGIKRGNIPRPEIFDVPFDYSKWDTHVDKTLGSLDESPSEVKTINGQKVWTKKEEHLIPKQGATIRGGFDILPPEEQKNWENDYNKLDPDSKEHERVLAITNKINSDPNNIYEVTPVMVNGFLKRKPEILQSKTTPEFRNLPDGAIGSAKVAVITPSTNGHINVEETGAFGGGVGKDNPLNETTTEYIKPFTYEKGYAFGDKIKNVNIKPDEVIAVRGGDLTPIKVAGSLNVDITDKIKKDGKWYAVVVSHDGTESTSDSESEKDSNGSSSSTTRNSVKKESTYLVPLDDRIDQIIKEKGVEKKFKLKDDEGILPTKSTPSDAELISKYKI